MSFASDLHNFTVKVEARNRRIFVGVAAGVLESIQVGSPVTGAPGQPVDTGQLRSSWQLGFESPTVAAITTNTSYALSNEDGIARPGGGPYRLRSQVGGRHSVKLTRVNFDKLVAQVNRREGGTG